MGKILVRITYVCRGCGADYSHPSGVAGHKAAMQGQPGHDRFKTVKTWREDRPA